MRAYASNLHKRNSEKDIFNESDKKRGDRILWGSRKATDIMKLEIYNIGGINKPRSASQKKRNVKRRRSGDFDREI